MPSNRNQQLNRQLDSVLHSSELGEHCSVVYDNALSSPSQAFVAVRQMHGNVCQILPLMEDKEYFKAFLEHQNNVRVGLHSIFQITDCSHVFVEGMSVDKRSVADRVWQGIHAFEIEKMTPKSTVPIIRGQIQNLFSDEERFYWSPEGQEALYDKAVDSDDLEAWDYLEKVFMHYDLDKILGSLRHAASCIVEGHSSRVHGIELRQGQDISGLGVDFAPVSQEVKKEADKKHDQIRVQNLVEGIRVLELEEFLGVMAMGAAHTRSGQPVVDLGYQQFEDVFEHEFPKMRFVVIEPKVLPWVGEFKKYYDPASTMNA